MGLFITFEGLDGSGKSTQIEYLKQYMISKGVQPIITREPGGTPIGEKIRALILDKENQEMDAAAEALLYAASRAQHMAEVIAPALERGKVVICDRYVDSSIAYQGYGRGLGNIVAEINRFATSNTVPNITFLIEVSPEIGRLRRLGSEDDRIEAEEISFYRRVSAGYQELAAADKQRIIVIDGTKSVDEIRGIIISSVEKLM